MTEEPNQPFRAPYSPSPTPTGSGVARGAGLVVCGLGLVLLVVSVGLHVAAFDAVAHAPAEQKQAVLASRLNTAVTTGLVGMAMAPSGFFLWLLSRRRGGDPSR